VFRFSRKWISQKPGTKWGRGPQLAMDSRGWITVLAPNCWADTPLCTIDGGHYPSGQYTVLYKGGGKIDFWGAAKVVRRQPGRIVIDVNPKRGPIWLRLKKTDPRDPIHDIHVLMPGFETSWKRNPWNPSFLRRWKGFAGLRFMDMMKTNNSLQTSWKHRPHLEDARWTPSGLPVEMLCDLANRIGSDPWFCMPHRADDNYIRQFARLVKSRLDSKRTVYIEYSNEVWNRQFSQQRWAAQQGQSLGLAKKPWEAGWRYTARRSKEIFAIWEDEFGGRDRLVRVLATQAANPYVSRQILEFENAWQHADALAIAPYFGLTPSPDKAKALIASGLSGVLDRVGKESLPRAIEFTKQQKEIAAKYGLKLIAYEGGQHLVGIRGAENNKELTRLFHEANRHTRIGEFYRRYYDAWARSGGDLMCTFSSVSRWSKWGSWGLLQYADENPADSPKFSATRQWAKAHGQDVAVP